MQPLSKQSLTLDLYILATLMDLNRLMPPKIYPHVKPGITVTVHSFEKGCVVRTTCLSPHFS